MKLLDAISKKAFKRTAASNPGPGPRLVYDIEINDLSGVPIHLRDFKGKYLLFVNVASNCGFTKQYKDLEQLYQNYKEQLMIIGVPCNQFGAQEPGSAEEIQNFCAVNYGVSFLLTEKVAVKGANQHPLYEWLTNKQHNGRLSSTVRWNFQKYLVGPEGQLLDYYYSTTNPKSAKITKHIT